MLQCQHLLLSPGSSNSLEHQALTQPFTEPQTGSGLCQPRWAPQIGLGPLLGNLSKGGGDKFLKKDLFFLAHRAGALRAHILNKGNLPLTLNIPVHKLIAPHSTAGNGKQPQSVTTGVRHSDTTLLHSCPRRGHEGQSVQNSRPCISLCAVSCCQTRRENPFQQKGHCAGPCPPRPRATSP